MSTLKKILMSLMILGAVGSTVGAGTFASFNSTTTNASGTFSTGSLVLGRDLNSSGTFCLSVGAGTTTDTNTNSSCSVMINATTVKLGDAATTVNLTIKNAGTVTGTLTYKLVSCSNGTNGTYYNGAGNICSTTNVTLQEYTTDTSGVFSNPKARCVYPSQNSACPALSSATAPTYTLASMPTSYTTTVFGSTDSLLSGDLRYYTLSIQQPANTGLSTADDTQGRKATFALSWFLTT